MPKQSVRMPGRSVRMPGWWTGALLLFVGSLLVTACSVEQEHNLKLWYDRPAEAWVEALPVGNGRLGAMVFGGVEKERIQFNEETLWTGAPNDYAHPGAVQYLGKIRQLLSEGKQAEAEQLAMEEFMSIPLRQMEYQPFGDIYLEFPDHANYRNYQRELDISNAVCRTRYEVDEVLYTREVIASHPADLIGIRLRASRPEALTFSVYMDAEHEEKALTTSGDYQVLEVSVKGGALKGAAGIRVVTDGNLSLRSERIRIEGAGSATIWMNAATNYLSYHDISQDPVAAMEAGLANASALEFETVMKDHVSDYRSLFDRFHLDFGPSGRDSLPTDRRLLAFADAPDDPSLIALYTQYGRYLLISSSRPGTYPANLQGIWNQDLEPAWGSKYTVNINTEMNYWPAELSNLSECHDPLFRMIGECAETGAVTAREHYGAEGWVLHHNTDIWRGTAPINHSNHGIWVSGSGWMCHHLWERYLFTHDVDFLRERAFPVMMGAARFYSQFLTEDPKTGWLISTPSNSPENGGLVAGPTMDHQIIRSLYQACIEAAQILGSNDPLVDTLKDQAGRIAPNQIGQYGQLQEWLMDIDDPENKHRHVSHLWGMHPGNDFNWDNRPDLMEACKVTLAHRGDEGTGWSLAWKINFWARLLEGDHAYELIKLQFRPVPSVSRTRMSGGGSYANLFDAHPPFQIDGNFGAPAGIIEMLIQSHRGAIDLLPALPAALPEGEIRGVCARGGFDVSFRWAEGKLIGVDVLSKTGETCVLRYMGKTVEFETFKGDSYQFDADLNLL